MSEQDFNVQCPCCQTKMVVDRKTGAVIAHTEPPKAAAKSFEEAAAEKAKAQADQRLVGRMLGSDSASKKISRKKVGKK